LRGSKKKYIIVPNTYADYLGFIKNNIDKDCEWIYNIIEKKTEPDRILFENDNFVLVIDMNMKPYNLETFHLLAFPKDLTLKSIRDLSAKDIPLLNQMIKKGKKFIKKNMVLTKIRLNIIFTIHLEYYYCIYTLHP
jgi:m7GpppX diphosphatase